MWCQLSGRHEEQAAVLRVVVAVRPRRVLLDHRRAVGTGAWLELVDGRVVLARPRHRGGDAARARCRRPGICPACLATTSSGRVAQVHTESSRVGTSVMPHLRHFPARSSMTSSSPAIVQTYEIGGSSTSPAGPFGFAGCASTFAAASAAARDRRPELLSHIMIAAARRPPPPLAAPSRASASRHALRAVRSSVSLAPTCLYSPMIPSRHAAIRTGVRHGRVRGPGRHNRNIRQGLPAAAAGPHLYGAAHRPRADEQPSNGVEHHFALNVPDTYDPAKKYQLRIQLHGGVGDASRQSAGGDRPDRRARRASSRSTSIPYAWSGVALVERRSGADNLHAISTR